jgi:PEGA domain
MAFVGLRVRHSVAIVTTAVAAMCALFGGAAYGQAVAETAGATSVAATAATSMKSVPLPRIPTATPTAGSTSGAASQHLIVSSGPPPQETNVREFQAHAGKDAGKVLLRATPVEANIWVNGKIVGKTPLLLVLAPGKYEVDMRGARGQTGSSTLDLLPHETREVVLKLHQLYPGRVTAQ